MTDHMYAYYDSYRYGLDECDRSNVETCTLQMDDDYFRGSTIFRKIRINFFFWFQHCQFPPYTVFIAPIIWKLSVASNVSHLMSRFTRAKSVNM